MPKTATKPENRVLSRQNYNDGISLTLMARPLTSLEVCAGAGGTALGIARAGFHHLALVELDKHAVATLRYNRPEWNVIHADLTKFDGSPYRGIDLLSGGVPCPPFSVAGKQMGAGDDRDLFPQMVRLTRETRPRAVMIENVPGLLSSRFDTYRENLDGEFRQLGYEPRWRLFNSSDFGVPQLRPRVVMVAMRSDLAQSFEWPDPDDTEPPTVGETLLDMMASRGWEGAKDWARAADKIAPTLVGGSKKHGGPDLGPTRSKRAWASLGVNAKKLADDPPPPGFEGYPHLTVDMAARLQGFPPGWHITGRKTNAYRQVGNAFPPPVAEAVARQIKVTLEPQRAVNLAASAQLAQAVS